MNEKALALQARTHEFLIRVVRFTERLPKTSAAMAFSRQLPESAGGTDSNYCSACRARSRKEFIAKVGVAAEEADESAGWLTALRDAGLGDAAEVQSLVEEAQELTKIFTASQKTARQNGSF